MAKIHIVHQKKAEMILHCYSNIFNKKDNIKIAIARAGNVIGGGDWSQDRLIPDCVNLGH